MPCYHIALLCSVSSTLGFLAVGSRFPSLTLCVCAHVHACVAGLSSATPRPPPLLAMGTTMNRNGIVLPPQSPEFSKGLCDPRTAEDAYCCAGAANDGMQVLYCFQAVASIQSAARYGLHYGMLL